MHCTLLHVFVRAIRNMLAFEEMSSQSEVRESNWTILTLSECIISLCVGYKWYNFVANAVNQTSYLNHAPDSNSLPSSPLITQSRLTKNTIKRNIFTMTSNTDPIVRQTMTKLKAAPAVSRSSMAWNSPVFRSRIRLPVRWARRRTPPSRWRSRGCGRCQSPPRRRKFLSWGCT